VSRQDSRPVVHVLCDRTRSGVISALIEIAQRAKIGMLLDEASIPISEEVRGAVHPCLTNADSAL
jgi:hydrogenase maturation factor